MGKDKPANATHLVLSSCADTDLRTALEETLLLKTAAFAKSPSLSHVLERKANSLEKIFPDLGIAALRLDGRQCDALQKHEDIAHVIPMRTFSMPEPQAIPVRSISTGGEIELFNQNPFGIFAHSNRSTPRRRQRRSTPRSRNTRSTPRRRFRTLSSEPQWIEPEAGSSPLIPEGVTPHDSVDLYSYILGQRDAMDSILDLMESQQGGNSGSAPSLPAYLTNFPFTWALNAIGVNGSKSQPTGRGVKVAVLDTGVDKTHPDFSVTGVQADSQRQRARLQGKLGRDFVEEDGSPNDRNGHGTHCAGLIGGPGDPKDGTSDRYAVAPDSELVIAKVADENGEGTYLDVMEGILFAIENQARVISLSLGIPRDIDEPFDPVFERIAQCLRNGRVGDSRGCLIFAASGNESDDQFVAPVSNPAACPSVVSIGAIDANLDIASFSNVQTDNQGAINFVAPGVNITTTSINGEYAAVTGTSMAAPIAAGVAALMMDKHPKLTAPEILSLLEKEALPLGDVESFGRGLIQVH